MVSAEGMKYNLDFSSALLAHLRPQAEGGEWRQAVLLSDCAHQQEQQRLASSPRQLRHDYSVTSAEKLLLYPGFLRAIAFAKM